MDQDRVRYEREMIARRILLATGLSTSLLTGCTYYEVSPGVYATAPASTFDRSWSAARNAFLEQSVRIVQEDRSTGTLRGNYNGIDVLALLRTQADGSVRVEFRTANATQVDPQLIERITSSYDRLMGR
jgi:hypothetical protein